LAAGSSNLVNAALPRPTQTVGGLGDEQAAVSIATGKKDQSSFPTKSGLAQYFTEMACSYIAAGTPVGKHVITGLTYMCLAKNGPQSGAGKM
jgi:hypothetical protein